MFVFVRQCSPVRGRINAPESLSRAGTFLEFSFQSAIVIVAIVTRVIGVTVIMATGYLAADDRASSRSDHCTDRAADQGSCRTANYRAPNYASFCRECRRRQCHGEGEGGDES
jgi:hypothetical protein